MKLLIFIFTVLCLSVQMLYGSHFYKYWDKNWVEKRNEITTYQGLFQVSNGCRDEGAEATSGKRRDDDVLLYATNWESTAGFFSYAETGIDWPNNGQMANATISYIKTDIYSKGEGPDGWIRPACFIIRAGGVTYRFVNIYIFGQRNRSVYAQIKIYGVCEPGFEAYRGPYPGDVGCHTPEQLALLH